MRMNEAQQHERIAFGIGAIAFSLAVLVLIALAKLAGPILAMVWAVVSLFWSILHFYHLDDLEDDNEIPSTQKD